MSLSVWSAVLLLVSMAQAGRRVRPEVLQAPLHIGVEFEVAGSTELLGSDGQAVLDPALSSLSELRWTGSLELELRLARRFRDGSLGWLIRVVEARRTAPGEEGPAANSDWSLQGRSVELRTFDDGEVLSVEPASQLMGSDRLGGLADVIGPLLSPHVPDIRKGRTERRTTRWALIPSAGTGLRMRLLAEWTALGRDAKDGPWRVAWAGAVDGRARSVDSLGGDEGGEVREATVEGQASGEVSLLDVPRLPVPLRLVDHRLTMTRVVETRFSGAPQGPIQLRQTQVVTATSRVRERGGAPAPDPLGDARAPQGLEPHVADRLPLDRYLDETRARAAMTALAEAMSPCAPDLPDGAYPLYFWISGAGKVLELHAEEAPAPVLQCLALASERLVLPPTDDERVLVRGSVLLRQGVAGSGPGIERVPRRSELDILLLPWWESPEAALLRSVSLGGPSEVVP